MARSTSPLRYPGGKTCLYPILARLIRENKLERKHYAEPFAGGCGLALTLLFEGHVSDIHINDIDPSIWAFWYAVLNSNADFIQLMDETPVTVEEWHRQRAIHLDMDLDDPLALGFSTFFLNRTNRSGIIKAAGVIGGLDQSGTYKIDCRYNLEDLKRRVRRVHKYKSRIHLTRLDALDFIANPKDTIPADAFLCIDPPYFHKGKGLYTSFYNEGDHAELAEKILSSNFKWIVTYDNAREVRMLYRDRRVFEFDINYSIETKRLGTEILIASKGLKIPSEIRSRQVNRPQYRTA